MAKASKEKEVSLEQIMWNCRNALRGSVGGNEKKPRHCHGAGVSEICR